MTNLKIEGTDQNFTMRRLVLINSAGHAYSEIPLDNHLALFGNNNVGKTASLSAIKLLLFPESSLANCASKFRFEGKKGAYSGVSSHKFYFPSNSSYLVLEVDNHQKPFCMVLYKPSATTASERLEYSRLFIPVSYDVLRPVFWDVEKGKHGSFADDISVARLLEFNKKHDGRKAPETDRALSDLMFGSYGTSDGRFCVLPLKDSGTESINAFRDIFNLAFGSSTAETHVLPSAIAAMIEMQRGRKNEALDTSSEIVQQFERLGQRRKILELRESNQGKYFQIADGFNKLKLNISSFSLKYHTMQHWLRKELQSHAPKVLENNARITAATNNKIEKQGKLNKVNVELLEQKTCHTVKSKDLAEKNGQLVSCQKIIGQYPDDHDVIRILELLREDAEDKEDILNAISSREENAKQLTTKQAQHKHKQQQLENIDNQLTQQNRLLMSQIDEHSCQVLHALNPNLVTVLADIDPSDHHVIEVFTSLFSIDESEQSLLFKSSRIHNIAFTAFDPEQSKNQLKQQRETLLSDSNTLDEAIKQLTDFLRYADNVEYTEKRKKEIQDDLLKCRNDIQLLDRYNSLMLDVPKEEAECAEMLHNIKVLEAKFEAQKKLLDEAVEEHGSLSGIASKLNEQIEYFQSIEEFLKASNIANLLLPDALFPKLEDEVNALPSGIKYIREIAAGLITQANLITKAHISFVERFKSFMLEVPELEVEAHRENPSMQILQANIDIYDNLFKTLLNQRKDFQNAVRAHNLKIHAQVAEIEDARSQLNRQIDLINQKLNGHRISNLSEIKLKLETKADFDALTHSLKKFNITGDQLADQKFYDSLFKFFEGNQNANGRLKMVNLIKSISYQYAKANGEVDSNSQSGGTSLTITSFVISILLNEIKEVGVNVHLPIVVDEVSTLDAANSMATIQQISEQGFSILCATPEFNAHVAESVGCYILIDKYRANYHMLDQCQMHLLPQHVNRFGKRHAD